MFCPKNEDTCANTMGLKEGRLYWGFGSGRRSPELEKKCIIEGIRGVVKIGFCN